MRTITITIQVPDGVNVQVGGAQQQQQQGNSDFVARPDPDYPDSGCVVCGNEQWRLIKAGFSKTKKNPDGTPKRFNAFYVCGTEGCDGKPGQVVEDFSSDQLPF